MTHGKPGPGPRGEVTVGRASAILAITFLSIGAGNYVFSIAIAHLLPPADFGIVQLVQTLVLFAAWFTNSGFPLTVARRLPKEVDREARAAVVQGALLGNTAIAVALAAVLLGLVALGAFKLGSASATPLVLAAVTFGLLGLNAAAKGALQGLFRFRTLALSGMVEVLLKLALGLTLARMGGGPTGAVLGILLGMLLATAISVGGAHDLAWPPALTHRWSSLLRETRPLFAGTAALALLTSIDIFAVKLLEPTLRSNTRVGVYQAAVTLGRLPYFLASALVAAVYPSIAGRSPLMAELYIRKGLLYTVSLLSPVALVLIVQPEAIVRILFPPSYGAAAAALRPLAAGTLGLSLVAFLAASLQALGDDRFAAKVILVAVGLEAALLFVAIPAGIVAGGDADLVLAASAFAIGSWSAVLALWARLARRFGWALGIRRSAAYLASAAALVAVLELAPHGNAIATAVAVGLAILAYFALALGLKLLSRGDLVTLGTSIGLPKLPWLTERAPSD